MNMPPAEFSASPAASGMLAGAGRAQFGQASASAFSMKWSALHDAAGVIASLAGLSPAGMDARQRNFPANIRDCGGWRRELAEQSLADLSAVLEPGLSALLSVSARGVDPSAPALALWEEFCAARDAMLGLLPPEGALGPVRRA
jgi:hypothetical protein